MGSFPAVSSCTPLVDTEKDIESDPGISTHTHSASATRLLMDFKRSAYILLMHFLKTYKSASTRTRYQQHKGKCF